MFDGATFRPAFVVSQTPPAPPLGDFPPETFAHHGHELIDWITRYLREIESYPVLAQTTPGAIAERSRRRRRPTPSPSTTSCVMCITC